MKIIEIARSFSKTIQEKQFEPINIFASYKAELDENDDIEKVSKELYEKAVNDVGLAISEKMWEKWTNPQKAVRKQVKEETEEYNSLKDSNGESIPF